MLSYLVLAALLNPISLSLQGIEPGETVRYPMVLVHGTAATDSVAIGRDWKNAVRFPVDGGHFSGFVELKPGKNMIVAGAGSETVKLRVDYAPMKTPYAVHTVYLVAKDEGTDYDGAPSTDRTKFREKLDLALKMMQSVAAESMKEAGYGRKTFPLLFDPDGKVHVEVVRTDLTGDALRSMDGNALWSKFWGDLSKRYDYSTDKICGVMAFTRWDVRSQKGLAHTALGGDALGLFGSGSMWSWPTAPADIPKVFVDDHPIDSQVVMDDSGLRGTVWASVATTIGAMLHEMGHTFGLPHSTDPYSAMSRGFDQFNRRFSAYEPPSKRNAEARNVSYDTATHWDSFEAARLNLSRWFQPDAKKFSDALPPRIQTEGDTIVVSAPYKLGIVAAVREGKPAVFKEYRTEMPQTVHVPRSEFGEGPATLIAIDSQGNQSEIKLP